MPRKLNVKAPDGREFTIEAPDDATDEEIEGIARQASGVGANYPVQTKNPITAANDKLGNKPGYQDLLMNGASFGLADEAAGGINALMHPMTTGAYAQGRDAMRARVDQAEKNTGWAGTAAEFAGGLLGGLPRAGMNALLTLGNSVRAGATTGAIGGAIGGFGSGDGAVDSLIKAGIGAGVGGTLGAALPVGASAITNRVSGISRMTGRDTDGLARQIVGETMQADRNAPAQIGRQLTEAGQRGTPLAIADTGENVRGLLASVARRPGPARSLTRNLVETRQAEQSDRVLGSIGENLGPIRNMRQQSDELMQQARTAARPLYDEAYSNPVISTPELDAVLNTPAGRGAFGRARTIAANERRDPEALGFSLDADSNVRLDPTLHLNEDGSISQEATQIRGYTPQTLDYVKRGLDDTIEQFRDPVTRRLNLDEAGRAINGVRGQLLSEVDRLNPAYGQARQAYAGPASAEEALQLGRSSLNASAEDIEAATARMGPAEREQFALGYRSAMGDNIGRAVDGADQTQRMLGTPRKRAALSSVMGEGPGFDRFQQTMADERLTNQTYRSVMSGSQTAERQLADQQTSDGGLIESAAGATLRGVSQPIGLLGDALKALGEIDRFGAGEAGNRTRESVAALLTETDPRVLEGLAKAVKDATTRQRLRSRAINRTTGKLGAGLGNNVGLATGELLAPQ
jgi:hypothetical protein